MKISFVPIGQVIGVMPSLYPFLMQSSEWSRGRVTVDDIVRFVLNGQMNLWAVHEEDKGYGHIVTEVKQYPQCKMLAIQYCAMTPWTMERIEDDMQKLAERVAKDAGCVGIEFVGRSGWSKTSNKYGYTVQSVTYQKFFKEV
jgi:hypothetical protein